MYSEKFLPGRYNGAKLLILTTVGITHKAFLLPFASHFRKKGWQVDGLAANITQFDECRDTYDNVFDFPFERNPFWLAKALSELAGLRELVLSNKYDIVHVHTPIAAFLTRFALRNCSDRLRPKIVYTAHGFHFFKGAGLTSLPYLVLEKLASYWTDCLITINREDLRTANNFKLAPKIMYMPGIGVDLEQYTPVSEQEKLRLRSELGLSQKDRCFIMVAEFNTNKRQRCLVEAIYALKDANIVVLFAGSGPLMSDVKKHVVSLGLEKQVRFLGQRNDVRALLSLADLNILPSLREGLPRSMMEAMAVGTPNVGSRIRGIVDLLDEDCGGLFDVPDVSHLTEQIKLVLHSPETADRWRNNARQKIVRFGLQEIIGLHEKLYSEILK